VVTRRTALSAGALLVPGIDLLGRDAPTAPVERAANRRGLLLGAARVFDGHRMLAEADVHVRGETIAGVGPRGSLHAPGVRRLDLGDATILPGIIDLHVHVTARGIPFERVLTHGVTTVRDLAGALPSSGGGPGRLRYLAAGPMITTPGGYPIPVFGPDGAVAVSGPAHARQVVRDLVGRGAQVIKIALEPGGEPGAPWTQRRATTPPPWPMLSVAEVRAIVEEAHGLGRIVTVHLAEQQGARIALESGVDEWAHIPCLRVPEALLRAAVRAGVRVVATLDTDSHCDGSLPNAKAFVALGGSLLYGTDMGHTEIPNGVDAEELQLLVDAGLSLEQALAGATAEAGRQLGLAPLGSLTPRAPADLIAVQGDPAQELKNLEYPILVVAGGSVVVDAPEATSRRQPGALSR
jgi:imidazolonepropionase-like amidohydrolase